MTNVMFDDVLAPLGRLRRPRLAVPLVAAMAFSSLMWVARLAAAAPAQTNPGTAQEVADLPAQYDLSTRVAFAQPDALVREAFDVRRWQGYALRLSAHYVALYSYSGHHSELLAQSRWAAPASGSPVPITVQRRAGHISVLTGAHLALDVQQSPSNGGAAHLSATGADCSTLRVQPIEAPFFSDDFMRQPNEPGDWTYVAGQWQIQTVGTVAWGANPFSLEAHGGPAALASAGYRFWSDYHFEVAARGDADGAFGLCAGLQDAKNHYLLRWTSGVHGALQLLRVANGKAFVLASRQGGYIPGQWYLMGVRFSGGRLIAEVDHQAVLNVEDRAFGNGKIGLYAEGSGLAHFDSVSVRAAGGLYDDFSDGMRWDVANGMALGGNPTWPAYNVSAVVVGAPKTEALVLQSTGGGSYYAVRWNASLCQLVFVSGSTTKVLAEYGSGVPVGSQAVIQAGFEDDYLWGAINGRRIVEAVNTAIPAGRAGFEPASEAGKSFRSVSIQAVERPEPTDALTTEFTDVEHHKEMTGWAGPLQAWEPGTDGTAHIYWHKSALYGDAAIHIPLYQPELNGGRFGVLLDADGSSRASGYELDYSSDGQQARLVLLRHMTPVARGAAPIPGLASELPGDPPSVPLDVAMRGSLIYVRVGKAIALQYRDPAPIAGGDLAGAGAGPGESTRLVSLAGPKQATADPGNSASSTPTQPHNRMGIIIRNVQLNMGKVVIRNRNTYAETFHLAPVNWRAQSGDWALTSRWSCTPGWTWYGGKSTGYAANWYKAPLWGDQTIDSYAGVMMSAVPDSLTVPYHEQWRDLDCAFCSDGVDLFSGYTLIVGGGDGSVTRLYRKGKKVAESTAFKFPVYSVAHRLWFNTRIRKDGGHIRVTVSYYGEDAVMHDFPLLDWTDPNPLPGGYFGFWTYDNGMMLARVVLSAQEQGERPLYTACPVWLASIPAGTPYPGADDAGKASTPLLPEDVIRTVADLSPVLPIGLDLPPSAPRVARPAVVILPALGLSPTAASAQAPSTGPAPAQG